MAPRLKLLVIAACLVLWMIAGYAVLRAGERVTQVFGSTCSSNAFVVDPNVPECP